MLGQGLSQHLARVAIMKTPADTTTTRRNAPLARDTDGNPFELPDGAAYWRVRRQTGGRPRKVLGVDRQPLRVPLEMTAEELEDVLGPSSYLLDLHDQAHNSLNITVPVTVAPGSTRRLTGRARSRRRARSRLRCRRRRTRCGSCSKPTFAR